MAASPQTDAIGVVTLQLRINGELLPETADVQRITIDRSVNTVPSARLVLADGDMPERCFPTSDADHFKPGARIVIEAGYLGTNQPLFEGIVVRHGLQILPGNDARLVVECRDAAVKMTVGRRNANHIDQSDADIIGALAQAHGLSAEVDDTGAPHAELAQHFCSDWDFVLSRADANGLLVVARDGALTVKEPSADGDAALTVTYGEDIIEFDADIDARGQYASAQGYAWDQKSQAVVNGDAADPAALPAQGDWDTAALADVIGLEQLRLQAGAPQRREDLTRWARAQQIKAGLSRLRGRVKFQGSAKADAGGLIELLGVGTRFSGKALVTGVRHEIADGNWTTEAAFGLAPDWFTERADVAAQAAAGLLPAVSGLQVGVVLKLDADPAGEHRVQVRVPVLQAASEGLWARLMQPHASKGFGAFFLPEIGDEVVLGYFADDPTHPVVLGALYSSARTPPYTLAAENNTKAIVTRCLARIEIDEADKVITLVTPGKNTVVLSDKDQSVLLKDQNGNEVELGPAGIRLTSPKDIVVEAKGAIRMSALNTVTIDAKADVGITGLNVACSAQVGLTAKGNASAELSAAGQTTVRGAMVMIN